MGGTDETQPTERVSLHASLLDEDVDSVAEVLIEIGKERERARRARLEATPDTPEEGTLSGYERGVKTVLEAFESLDVFEREAQLPEWQVGLENEAGEWEWYYPHTVTREQAIEQAKAEAREDLGDGRLNAYEVGGPIAE